MTATVTGGVVTGGPFKATQAHTGTVPLITASSAGDPVRDVRLVMPDRPGQNDGFAAAYQANANPAFFLWNPDFVASLKGFSPLRLMDTMGTNGSGVVNWSDRLPARPAPGLEYARGGIPYEWWVQLANQCGSDVWVNVPHLATDAYVTSFANFLLANLSPHLKVYVEYSNECWNTASGTIVQREHCETQGVANFSPTRSVPPMSEVTRILSAIEQGDPHAAEQLLPLVYDELRKLAAQKLASERLVGKSLRSSDSSGSDASRANVLAELQSEDTFPDSL
jgi:hypothetical protein